MIEKQNFIQSDSSGIEWINDFKKKEQQKAEKPARSPQRLNHSIRRLNKLEISPKREEKLEETQDLAGVIKTKDGASKNLKDYDCW